MPTVADNPIVEEIESELEDAESSPAAYEIATYPADFTLQVLYEKWKAKEIDIPSFQRQFIWTQNQASKLIESFLMGLPVPGIFLYTDKKTENFRVIDGQQRLKSIFYFFEGYFGEEQKNKRPIFRLTGISEQSRWYHKTFGELKSQDEPSAKRLSNAVLRAFVIKQLDPKDDTSIFHLFERLNTGGTLLRGQEVRNCVYEGPFNDLLKELNKNETWRSILGKKSLDTHMRDEELILRFLAFSEALSDYEKPMKGFLSKFMNRNKNASESVMNRYRTSFLTVVNAVHTQLGPKPFHVHTAMLNAAVYDAVFVALAHTDSLPSDLSARYENLKKDKIFIECTTSGTANDTNVQKRMSRAQEILLG
jgi:uncharacterized protein with ParB-like and HNH nuclease domain